MGLPTRVTLYEVGPRDGLQNEAAFVPTDAKVEFVNRLSAAGFRHIEVTSFVAPKWIPQLADAAEVLSRIDRRPGVVYSALVPNEQGLERALASGVDQVNVFMSASETHNRKNINKSIAQTYPVLQPVIATAKQHGKPVRGYVSTVWGCPYEGRVRPEQVMDVVERLLELGVDEISLGDTIGVAAPPEVTSLLKALTAQGVPLARIALHFHDTRGTAVANVCAGLAAGVTTYDSSLGGLGGCPYAKGASGNVATDDLLYLFDRMGIETAIDIPAALETARWFESVIGKPLASHSRAVARGQEGEANDE